MMCEFRESSSSDVTASKAADERGSVKLCQDIIENILIRLPAKSVGRFRCVCKEWLALSSDLRFVRAHHSYGSVSGFFLVNEHPRKPKYFTLDESQLSMIADPLLSFVDLDGSPAMFDHSCNGLILCHHYPSGREYHLPLYVSNPMTEEYAVIFSPPRVIFKYLSLAFDPFVCPQFKIVGICTYAENSMSMHIFSSETWSWKLLVEDLVVEFEDILFDQRSTFWNGSLVWLGEEDSLLSLDVKSEQLRRLPSWNKSGFDANYFKILLSESKGHLYFVGTFDKLIFDVLQMETESYGWSLLYRIDFNVIPEANIWESNGLRSALAPVYFLPGVEGGDQLFFSIHKKIVSYNFKDNKYKTVCDNVPLPCGTSQSSQVYQYDWWQFHPHINSLCSVELFSTARRTIESNVKRFEFQATVSKLINTLCSDKNILLRELISNISGKIDKTKLLALIDMEILDETNNRKRENMNLVKYSESIKFPVYLWPSKEPSKEMDVEVTG